VKQKEGGGISGSHYVLKKKGRELEEEYCVRNEKVDGAAPGEIEGCAGFVPSEKKSFLGR